MQAKLKEPGQQMGVEVVGQGRQAPRRQEEEEGEGWQLQRQDGGVESETEGFGSQIHTSCRLAAMTRPSSCHGQHPHHAFHASHLFPKASQGMLKLLHPDQRPRALVPVTDALCTRAV